MKSKIAMILCMAVLLLCAAGCSEKQEESATTTLTGMVVSVEGTVVNLMETGSMGNGMGNWGGQRPSNSEGGQRPEGSQRPEGDFTMPEGWQRPEGDFTMPEGDFTMPEGMERPTRPEGEFDPNNFDGELPEGATMPSMPADGSRPNWGNRDENGTQLQTTAVDLKNAHISIQDGDIKAAGSMSDIKVGSMLTITLNGSGEAIEVLVTSSGFSGNFGGGNFGGFNGAGFGGGRGNRPNNPNSNNEQAA